MKKMIIAATGLFISLCASAQSYHFEPVRQSQNSSENTTTSGTNNGNLRNAESSYGTANTRTGLRKYPMEFGGNLGFGFGNNSQASIQIAPSVGWKFNQYISAGVGVDYMFYKYGNNDWGLGKFKQHYLGASVYARGRLFNYFALYARPEINYMWGKQSFTYSESLDSKWVPSLILGGGVYIPAGPGAITLMVYYDVIQNDYSPYGSSIGYSFGYLFNF